MPKRSVELYLDDIRECIERIEEYTRGHDREAFFASAQLIDAVVRRMEIIGEAAHQLPEEFRVQHPEIPWGHMIGMRNKVTHEYFGVDEAILWQTIQEDIPKLRGQLQKFFNGR